MVQVDGSLAVQIVNFIILIFALNLVLYKPIRSILMQRKAKIKGLEDGISATTQETEGKNQNFAKGLREARVKGQKQKEALLQSASNEERALIAKINTQAQQDMAAVKARIAKDTEAVKVTLEKEVDAFANAILQKILGRTA